MMNIERTWIEQLAKRFPQGDFRHDTFFDPQSRQILTTDMLVEGIHFDWAYFTPEDLGWKAIAVNLSDIAATGGVPLWCLVSIGMPQNTAVTDFQKIYDGIEACCKTYRCQMIGGDTVQSPQTTISITLVGVLPQGYQAGRRHLAQPDDVIAVSGPHGLSKAGLEALQRHLDDAETAKQAHLRPLPQLKLGQQIAKILPRFAMMDSSDGLADAALRLAECSGVDIILESKRLTPHPDVDTIAHTCKENPLDWVLYGGEDFHLVVSLPPETLGIFPELKAVGYARKAVHPEQGQAFLQTEKAMVSLTTEKLFQHFRNNPKKKQPKSSGAKQ